MSDLTDFYHWITTSPNLIEHDETFSDLQRLSSSPLDTNARYQGNSRLGFIYQHLCTQAFTNSAHYQVTAEEIQLSDKGKTLGAIDLIVHNQTKQLIEHWEVAVKFYLLHQGIWYGPNAHDQLDKKLHRMLSHQLAMSNSAIFQQQYPELNVDAHRLLMQGRLYTNPFNNEQTPSHCLGHKINSSQINGYWCYYSQAEQIPQPLYELPKIRWATGKEEHAQQIKPSRDQFIHGQTADGKFWFVVPDCWPK